MNRTLRLPLALILITLGLSYTAGQTLTWTGSLNTNWNRAANWSRSSGPPRTPQAGDTIIIPNTSRGLYPVMNGDYNIGAGGSIRIDSGASLTTGRYNIRGGIITNNGTLELNGEQSAAGFTATLATASSGEVHVINTGTVSPLNLRISGNMPSLSLLKIDVPSGRTVNLNGSINLSTGNFELKGGVLTGDATETFTVGGTSQLDGNITSAANVTLSGAVTLVSDVTITTSGATAVPTFSGTIDTAATSSAPRSLTVDTFNTVPRFSTSAAVGSTNAIDTLIISTSATTGTVTVSNPSNQIGKVNFSTFGAAVDILSSSALEVTGNAITNLAFGNGDITLTSNGDISINTQVDAGNGNILLKAGGAVNQGTHTTAAPTNITASGLALTGLSPTVRGRYTLTNGFNDVTTLAADTGAVSYTDISAVTVDAVTVGVTPTTGVNTNNRNFILEAGGPITINNTVNAGSGNILLKADGTVMQGTHTTAAPTNITAGGLALVDQDITSRSTYTLTNGSNSVGTLAADTGTVSYRASGGVTIGEVNVGGRVTGVKTNGNNFTLRAGGAIDINNQVNAVSTTGAGDIFLTAGGTIRQPIRTPVTLNKITAGGLALSGSGGALFNLNNNSNDVTTLAANHTGPITYYDADRVIVDRVGSVTGVSTNGNNFTLRSFGTGGPTGSGRITIQENITAVGTTRRGNVILRAERSVSQNTGGTPPPTLQGGELQISGNASYSLRNNNDFERISTVIIGTSATGTTRTLTSTGTIRYNDTNGLVIRELSSTSNIIVTAGASGGTLEVAGSISAGITGTVRLATISPPPPPPAAPPPPIIELRKAAPAFRITAGTSISLSTQGSKTITNTGTGQSLVLSALEINLQTESGSTGAIGAAASPIVTSGSTTVNIGDSAAGATAWPGTVYLTNTDEVTTNGTLTVGRLNMSANKTIWVETDDDNPLELPSGDINAGNGSINFRSGTSLTTGGPILLPPPPTPRGKYTTTGPGDKISLKAKDTLTIANELDAGSGTTGGNVLLKAGGAVTQDTLTTADPTNITANALVLTDQNPGAPSAAYTLTNNSNNVTTLAANTGAVSYTDSNGVNIGSVTFDGQTTTGVNTTGNVVLKAGGSVTQTASIKAAALVLTDQGLSSTPPAASPSATYTLTNTSNDVGTLAANTGEVSYTDTNGVDIGAVGTTSGVATNGSHFSLKAAGDININNQVNTTGTITASGNISLETSGAINQLTASAASSITANGLELRSPLTGTSGNYTLNNDNNRIDTLAADNSSNVTIHNNGNLDIGLVNSVGGISMSVYDLTIKASGTITQTNTVTANFTNLTAENSSLTPPLQDITLQASGNDFGTVIFKGNDVALTDSNDLRLGGSTVSNAGRDLTVQAGGNITDNGAIEVTSGLTKLDAGGSGDVILDNPSHDFSDTGSRSIVTGTGVVTVSHGVTVSNAANVTLADKNDIKLIDIINISGDLEVRVPLTAPAPAPGSAVMHNIKQSSDLNIPGDVKFRGSWNLANKDLRAKSIIALAAAVPGEKGNLIADAGGTPPRQEQITVSENFQPDTFTAADSKLIFTGAGPSTVGRNTPGRVTDPYTFNDIQIDKAADTARVTADNNWDVRGSLDLRRGRWILGSNSHTVHGDWNSSPTGPLVTAGTFQFNSAGSTVIFAGGNASVTTGGTAAPGQSFNNIAVRKSGTGKLTLGSGIKVDGNLTIEAGSGAISTGTTGTTSPHNIVISGDWTNNSSAAAFEPGNGTVIFNNSAPAAAPKKLTTGGSVFNHLTVRGNSRVNVKDELTVNGNLAFRKVPGAAGRAAPVLDMEKNNLTVKGSYNALAASVTPGPRAADELGRLRLRGGQTVSLQPPSSASPSSPLTMRYLGIVEYYGSGNASIGTITPGPGTTAQYWHLVISGGTVARLSDDITILGRSGAAKGTLAEPLETEYDDDDDLMGLFIKDKGSSLILNQKTLTLYGSFQNRSGAALNLSGKSKDAVDRGTVNFVGNYPAFIYGKNTFFKFNINDQSGTDRDVGGKIVYFQQHSGAVIDGAPVPPNEPVTEIANYIGAEINILGDNRNGQPTGPPASLPDSSEWVYLVSSGTDKGKYWLFDKEPNAKISLKYVYIRNSDARLHVQSIPDPETVTKPDGTTVEQPIVITEDSLFWFRLIVVEKSVTEDLDADGRIDRILVTAASSMKRKAAGAYEQLEITVKGYKVKAKPDGYSDGPESTQFYINLVEGNTLDTGARPPWRITENLSFIDAGAREEVLKLKGDKEEETPEDGAPPIIGYALAVADSPRNEVFIRFSEPVIDSDKDGWKNNFDFTALENVTVPGDISSVKPVSPGGGTRLEEAVVNLGKPVTLEDIYENREFTVSNVKDTADNDLRYDKHRVSDLALGITGNGIVQPTAASGRTSPVGGSSVGAIVKFDGTDFLEADKIRIEAARQKLPVPGSSSTPAPRIFYDNSVSAAFRANGLWLPPFNEGNKDTTPGTAPSRPPGTFSGLVPQPWDKAKNKPMKLVTDRAGASLFEYTWRADDKKIENNSNLEFFFYLPSPKGSPKIGNLYGARLIDDTASDWYRGVRPWSFLVRDFIEQAGGVTILNNIINPLRGERTSLQYQVTDGGTVTIQVFDLSGNMVEILQRGYQAPGDYAVSWDGRNRGGGIAARGIYFIRYVGPGGIDQIRKVLVVK